MSDIDFQNGFICGMATKGLVRSGELYKPIIWNDEGVYSYFYIDFRRAMEEFSTGMFNESIVVHDSAQLDVTNVEYISVGVYKITCNIADKVHGITVLNKKTSMLAFSNGQQLPVFSVHFWVAGVTPAERLKYLFSQVDYTTPGTAMDKNDFTLWPVDDVNPGAESTSWIEIASSITETPMLTLT
jgi:hypothetical protein